MKLNHVWAISFSFLATASLAKASDPIEIQVGAAVGNFHMVDSSLLYRGAHASDDGIRALAAAGIKTVIDLQGGDRILGHTWEAGETDAEIQAEKDLVTSLGMNFVSKPLNAMKVDFDDQAPTVDEIMQIINDPRTPRPIFFHCFHGRDRTGLIAALYRVQTQGCTERQAHAEMMADGHSPYLFWIDRFFSQVVAEAGTTPAGTCPLPLD